MQRSTKNVIASVGIGVILGVSGLGLAAVVKSQRPVTDDRPIPTAIDDLDRAQGQKLYLIRALNPSGAGAFLGYSWGPPIVTPDGYQTWDFNGKRSKTRGAILVLEQ